MSCMYYVTALRPNKFGTLFLVVVLGTDSVDQGNLNSGFGKTWSVHVQQINMDLIGHIYSGRRYVLFGIGVTKQCMNECISYLHLGGFAAKFFDV